MSESTKRFIGSDRMRRQEEPIFLFHRSLIVAKSANEHGTILNFDDMQMGRVHPLHYQSLTIPESSHYPIIETISPKIREEMRDLGFADFWDYFFNAGKVKALRKKEKEKTEKKKHWLF
jgi:hypothetical protein